MDAPTIPLPTRQPPQDGSRRIDSDAEAVDSQKCQTCSKIIETYKAPFSEDRQTELGKVSDLWAGTCNHTTLIETAKSMWPDPLNYPSQTMTFHKSKNSTTGALEIYYEEPNITGVRHDGRSFGLVVRQDEAGHPGRVRMLDPAWVNADLLRMWRTVCLKVHGVKCENHRISSLESSQPLFLIDVLEGCIVDNKSNLEKTSQRYVTLSYTWGLTKNFRAKKANFTQLLKSRALTAGPIADQIPRTIRDAMGIVKALGERYLWVDSLCIIQDDDECLLHEIHRMHLIYANSFLCLLAAKGSNAEYGLRGIKGVSTARSMNQVVVKLAGADTLAIETEEWEPPGRALSGYWSRAWTFQEHVFAKRRLVFGDGRLTWQCNSAAWYEDLISHRQADEYYANLDSRGQLKWMTMELPSLQSLSGLIKDFNYKVLSFPEDMSSAFAGIQSYLSKFYQGGLTYGLPEFFFDIALFWLDDGDCKRRKPSSHLSHDLLQDGLPSWSWIGWEGTVSFPTDSEFETILSHDGYGFTEPVTKWYTLSTPTAQPGRRIASQWHAYRTGTLENRSSEWIKVDYSLSGRMGGGVAFRPKERRSHLYKHSTDTSIPIYWYTLPSVTPPSASLPSSSEASPIQEHQAQYLSCTTTRAFLYATKHRLLDHRSKVSLQVLHDSSGSFAGGLELNTKRDALEMRELLLLKAKLGSTSTTKKEGEIGESDRSNDEFRIELIAIAKGWTTLFKTLGMDEAPNWMVTFRPTWEVPDLNAEEDDDYTKQWKQEKSYKDDCVFVLRIEWRGEPPVAYRIGSGMVLKEVWEREAEEVKVILG